MKKWIVLIIPIAFLLLSFSVSAEFNTYNAYTYMTSKSTNGSYGSIMDTSLVLMALNAVGKDVSREIAYLKSQENEKKCWPKQSCTVKDTAFAIIALSSAGQNLENEQNWLEKAQSAAILSGNWFLEIATQDTGTCRISYEVNNQTIEKSFNVVRGVFTQCGNSTFFDINNCLGKGIIRSKPSLQIDVNCDSLSSVDSITILYQTGNSFYLVDEEQSSRASLLIKNGCFGSNFQTACDYDSSLYANFALKALQSPIDTLFYLKQNYDPANPSHNAILYIVSSETSYLKELSNRQRNDGSWNENIYQTALADLALKDSEFADSIENSKKYFEKRQLADGSLGNVPDTALTLYAVYGDASMLPECFKGEIRLCEKQATVCEGSYETCKNNTFFGCTDDVYKSFNSSYEAIETKCDGLDNDCDGNIDTGCDCSIGMSRPCGIQYGICNGTIEKCGPDGKWPGCDYLKIPGYEETENSCNDGKDNDCDNSVDFADDDCMVSSICDEDGICDAEQGETADNCPYDCSSEDTCNNNIQDDFEEGIDCGGVCDKSCELVSCSEDGICDAEQGETSADCPYDCSCGDGVCDAVEETELICPEDCEIFGRKYCNLDGFCDKSIGETADNCPADCQAEEKPQEKSSANIIWYILLILILLGIVGYYIYKKKYKKGTGKKTSVFGQGKDKKSEPPIFQSMLSPKEEKSSASKSPVIKSFSKSNVSKQTAIEKELEKSIKEANKFIGKEK